MNKHSCKHYNGDHFNKTCLAGVCYRDVTTEPDNINGVAYRKPCVDWSRRELSQPLSASQLSEWEKRGKCNMYQEPTDAELKQYEETQGVSIARPAIIADLERRHKEGDATVKLNGRMDPEVEEFEDSPKNFVSGAGKMPCPVCKTGTLGYFRAGYNGHVHARCSTKDCVAWME